MKPNALDRCFELIDLALRMGAGIARIGNEIAHRTVGDGQPRGRRCWVVHEEEPMQKQPTGAFAPSASSEPRRCRPTQMRHPRLSPVRTLQMSDVALAIACFRASTTCFAE